MLWFLVGLVGASVPDRPPAPLELTADEQAEIAKGKVPVRFTDGGTGGGVVGAIDIAADPKTVWAAIFDMGARLDEISGLREATVYEKTPTRMGVRWVVSVLGSHIQFHVLYELEPDRGWCRYRLDTSKDNDLADVQGAYQVYAHGAGTRLIYRSETDSGRRVPGFIKRWAASDSLTAQLQGIQKRAEKF